MQSGTLTLGVKDILYKVNSGCSATARTDVTHFYENLEEHPLNFFMTVYEKHSDGLLYLIARVAPAAWRFIELTFFQLTDNEGNER